MDAAAERREDADAPVAQLVAAALDEDRAVVGDDAGGRHLIGEVAQQVLGGLGVEIVVAHEALDRRRRRHGDQRAHELADGPAELERTADGVGLPERHLARFARGRRDEHAVVGDLLDAPGRRAEEEGLADAALEHHLFVELADARARAVLAGEEDTVQAAIGNRAAVGHGDAARTLTRGDHVLEPVPRQPRPQVGEVVRRIAARQHVEHALERAAGELGERRGAAHGVEEAIDRPLIERHHRDDLLRQDVERVARIPRALDLRLVHRARDGRARDQIAAELGHDDAAARLADRVARRGRCAACRSRPTAAPRSG